MKTLFYIHLCLVFSLTAFAQKAQLTVVDPNIDASDLKNFDVHYGSTHKSSIPKKSDRDGVLSVVKEVQSWDELEKDLLYMDLKRKDLDALKKKYPTLTIKELTKLKNKLAK